MQFHVFVALLVATVALTRADAFITLSKGTRRASALSPPTRVSVKGIGGRLGDTYESLTRLRGGASSSLALIESVRATSTLNPTNFFNSLFVALMGSILVFKGVDRQLHSGKSADVKAGTNTDDMKPAGVRSLQARFLGVFWLLRLADWLQGPYFYDVYASKIINGLPVTADMISRLFLVGFASTGILGPWIGKLVDRSGRKTGTIAFSALYTLAAISTRSSILAVLLLGRLMGGIGTSLLFSAPESWMVGEMINEKHDGKYIGQTFGLAYAGDSLIAILAGQLASIMAAKNGPTGPFTLSVPFLWMGSLIAALKWRENVAPKSADNTDFTIASAFDEMKKDKRIALVGAMQALFEGAMYIFVLQWCPAMRQAVKTVAWGEAGAGASVPFGKIFSCFMASCLFGSSVFAALQDRKVETERIAKGMMVVAAVSMTTAVAAVKNASAFGANRFYVLISAFMLFEACVGMYFPSIGTLRSKYLPDSHRGVIMNIFGVPLNLVVVSVNLLISYLGVTGALSCSAATLTLAAGCAAMLSSTLRGAAPTVFPAKKEAFPS
jgi:hypothetical protein